MTRVSFFLTLPILPEPGNLFVHMNQQNLALVSVDPGLKGAVCIYKHNTYTFHLLAPLLERWDYWQRYFGEVCEGGSVPVHFVIEKAQSMPGNKAAAMFNYGQGFGRLLAWTEAMHFPYTLIRPQEWTKVMHQGTKDDAPKARSYEAARRLFPTHDFIAPGGRVPHDGFIDAALICLYGRRLLLQPNPNITY